MEEKLIGDVIAQIQLDVQDQDLGALEEFLRGILNFKTKKYYQGYLSEERVSETGLDDIYPQENE